MTGSAAADLFFPCTATAMEKNFVLRHERRGALITSLSKSYMPAGLFQEAGTEPPEPGQRDPEPNAEVYTECLSSARSKLSPHTPGRYSPAQHSPGLHSVALSNPQWSASDLGGFQRRAIVHIR